MTTYRFETPPGEPVVILTLFEDFDFKDMAVSNSQAYAILEKCDTPVFWIVNLQAKIDLEKMLLGSAGVTQGADALWQHPMIREILLVSPQELVHAAAPGFSTEAFGNLNVRAFTNMDEVLAYIRSQT